MEYLLKASMIIGVGLLFYKLLLEQETFFKANRLFFIAFLVFAFLIPLVSLPELVKNQGIFSSLFESNYPSGEEVRVSEESKATEQLGPQSIPTPTTGKRTTLPNEIEELSPGFFEGLLPDTALSWLVFFYFFGVTVFTLNLLFQTANILIKVLNSPDKIKDGKFTIVNTQKKQAPCSFFNFIFIYPADYDFETYEQIIAHEKIHVEQRHSYDLLLAELGVIILWFNPLMWLYKRSVEKNIEYQTDSILLMEDEVAKDHYQFNLLQIAVPDKPLAITTNYNQSLLKQRIIMMNAKRSNLSSYWKYTFLAPVLLSMLLFLNKPASGQTTSIADESVSQKKEQKEKIKAKPKTKAKSSFNININGDVDISQGFWYGHHSENEYCIDFKGKENSSGWNISKCFEKSEFKKDGDNAFTRTNEAGTLKLIGPLDQEVSQGKYVFTKDASFENYLAKNNLMVADKNLMFHFFLQDVTKEYVEYLKSKFKSITGEQLLAMAIHEVDRLYIESLASAGF